MDPTEGSSASVQSRVSAEQHLKLIPGATAHGFTRKISAVSGTEGRQLRGQVLRSPRSLITWN